ncbi:lipid-binding SYLF domain-containing protein [Kosmotoga pacifica]|uniref:Ysc84 actin-binding domain-containing protein n=1 Tax=Kosmotoga pacifica TaxID=1330330 RepID=A0A0G2Z5K6_9BACT|nr:lipid-binding SYLF domain-containing protein [Kosmotoga pacifica]AKI96900.1 hypothetical protein IX53_02650 [Kosmotoga pacifica]
MKVKYLVTLFILSGVMAMGFYSPVDRFIDAKEVLKELLSMPENDAFKELLSKAQGIAFFPNVLKAGLVIGGQYGEGFVLRKKDGVWYGPLFLKLYKVSYGPQIGAQSIRLVLLIMNDTGFEGFTRDNITLGGSIGIAAGPVGRNLSADIDYTLQAILSYSISKGFFVGFTVEGSVIKIDYEANEVFYGNRSSAKELLETEVADSPELRSLLDIITNIE